MEYQEIINLLGNNIRTDKAPRYTIKKWIKVNDQSGGTCSTDKQIRFKTTM